MAQIATIVLAAPTEYTALFWTVGVTGMRLGKLLALCWRHIDFDRGIIRVEDSVWRGVPQGRPKTDESEAELLMPSALAEVLLEHQARKRFSGANDFVFGRLDGTPADPDHLRRQVLYPLLRKVGIEPKPWTHGFHLFRHSVGSMVTMAVSLKAAQEILRHSRFETTANTYAHLDGQTLRNAMELLAGQLKGVLSSERVQ